MSRRHVVASWFQWLPLLAVLGLALALRLSFVTGMVFLDDFGYAQAAFKLTRGVLEVAPWAGGLARVGMYAPVALLYSLFGVSDMTTLAWPLLCSMLGVVFVYALGRHFGGEPAGLIAGLLWAVFPLDIQGATALLPDGPLATWTAGVVLFFMLSEEAHGPRSVALYVASMLCLIVAMLIKPLAILVLPFLVIYILYRSSDRRQVMAAGGISLLGIVLYAYYLLLSAVPKAAMAREPLVKELAVTATDWFELLARSREFYSWLPLFIVATVAGLLAETRKPMAILLWATTFFLYFELGSVSLFHYTPISASARHLQLLFVMLPFVVLTGLYLAQTLSLTAARSVTMVLTVAIGTVALSGNRGSPGLSWGVTGQEDSTLPFAALSSLGAAIAIFGGIASPLFVARPSSRWKTAALALLLSGVMLAALNPIYMVTTENKLPWQQNFRDVLRFLADQPRYPILVQTPAFATRLDFASGYQLGFDYFHPNVVSAETRLRVAPAAQDALPLAAYLLVDDYYQQDAVTKWLGAAPAYFKARPPNWTRLAAFGVIPNHRLWLYRVSPKDSTRALEAARATAPADLNGEGLKVLMEAAIQSGNMCEAVGAWRALTRIDPPAAAAMKIAPLVTSCLKAEPRLASANLIANGDFTRGLEGWGHNDDSQLEAEVVQDRTGPVWHGRFKGGNWNVLDWTGVLLQPDTLYWYQVTVRTNAPVVMLYWQSEIGRSLEEGKAYPDWVTMRYAFVTPHWAGKPYAVNLCPVLMLGPGEAWIKQARLQRLRIRSLAP